MVRVLDVVFVPVSINSLRFVESSVRSLSPTLGRDRKKSITALKSIVDTDDIISGKIWERAWISEKNKNKIKCDLLNYFHLQKYSS